MNKLIKILTALALTAGLSTAAFGQSTLAEWNTSGFAGTETTIAASNVATNLSISAIGLGSALGTTGGGGGVNTNGWTTDLNGANGNYWGFSVTVDSGFLLELNTFQFTGRSSNTGPRDFAIRYSGDSFASNIDTFNTSGSNYIAFDVDLSGLGVLSAGTYEFQVGLVSDTSSNGTGTVGTAGTHRIMNYGSTSATASSNPINLTGTVTAVPEPATYAAIVGLLALGLVLVRRRMRS